MAVLGTDRIQPVGARLPRPGRVTIRFGTPLRFDRDAGRPEATRRREITDEIMTAIRALSGQEAAGCYNQLSAG
ncbi:hypothetical protein [Plantactinospora sp. KBS50]|uniref:hypothetical protein n=1 Tax=Plantactinospora sp. KBS50 TaxID=2024580 RepID=UPI001E5C8D0F|nr:hypothetical protein [Plantactinospora sp. KBS50]